MKEENYDKIFQEYINTGLTSVEEPVKFNTGTKELKDIIDKFGEDKCITLMVIKTGIGNKLAAADSWDGEFIDFTDYGSF